MRNYYVVKNGANAGPYTLDQLKYHGILPETMVWYEGLPEWVEARAVPELSELFVVPVSMAVPPPIKQEAEGTDWRTIFWRIAAGVTFILMIVVGAWRLNGGSFPPKPEPKLEPIGPVDPPKPIPDVVPTPDQDEDKKAEYRKNWRNYVLAEIDLRRIKYNAFGGMSDVFVRITNNMPYEVELVNVQATYYLESGKIWKEPYFSFYDLPQSSSLFQIDGSHRGVKVGVSITKIRCEEIGIGQDYFR